MTTTYVTKPSIRNVNCGTMAETMLKVKFYHIFTFVFNLKINMVGYIYKC